MSQEHSPSPSQEAAEVTEPTHRSGLGYMLALDFNDQGTGSFLNILSFLCLASLLGGVRIVEPFLVGSVFGQNVSAKWLEETTFSDVFDSTAFHLFAASENYSPLVPFDTFLKDAPRKLLVAQYQCNGLRCRQCGHEDVLQRGRVFSKLNGFEMVGHVCLEYGSSGMITVKQMESQLYATYNRSEIVIMFEHFGGMDKGRFSDHGSYRLFMSPPLCLRSKFFAISAIRPSQLVTNSADRYIQTFLNGKRYISVMVRLQMILRADATSKQAPVLTETCLDHLYKKLEKIKGGVHIADIFLSLDVGKYGSNIFRNEEALNPLLPYYNKFISQTIKKGMTLLEWDATFSEVTLRQDPGFVAVMQKVIAARGDVLVLLGATSNFQTSTRNMYNHLHAIKTVFQLKDSCM